MTQQSHSGLSSLQTASRVLLVGAAGGLLAVAAQAQGTPAASLQNYTSQVQAQRALGASDSDLRRGQKLAKICANCHGNNGVSTYPNTPNLAGQNPGYLMEQMRKFADGRRKDAFMEGMIKAMNEQEKASVVQFYSMQNLSPKAHPDAALTARGRDYYQRICFRCHGTQGYGDDGQKIPRIAGQQFSYLKVSLTRYRDRSGERLDPLMAENMRNMKNDEIAAAAAYVSQMK